MDNISLLKLFYGEYKLKQGLREGKDYVFVYEHGWKVLVHRIGLIHKNLCIKRPVVLYRVTNKKEVEVHER